MSIGSQIAARRRQIGMTQQALAEKLDVSFQAVSSWEREEFLPETDKLKLLAHALNTTVSYLMEENLPKEKSWEFSENLDDKWCKQKMIEGITKEIPLRFAGFMDYKKINPKEISQILGVEEEVVEQYRTGEKEIPVESFAALYFAYNISPNYLIADRVESGLFVINDSQTLEENIQYAIENIKFILEFYPGEIAISRIYAFLDYYRTILYQDFSKIAAKKYRHLMKEIVYNSQNTV